MGWVTLLLFLVLFNGRISIETTDFQSAIVTDSPTMDKNGTTLNISLGVPVSVSNHSSDPVHRPDTQVVSLETLITFRFIIMMFLLPLICIPGCVCNVLNIFVLTRKRMRNSTNYILTALGVADLIYLLWTVLRWIFYLIHYFNPELYAKTLVKTAIYAPFDFVGLASGRGSNVLVLLLSVERFIAVKFPLKVKMSLLSRHPVRVIATIVIVLIAILIPNLFKYKDGIDETSNTTRTILEDTVFYRSNPDLFRAYTYFLIISLRFVPVFSVFFLNIYIIFTLRRSKKMMADRHARNNNLRNREQLKITRMLIAIAIIFLVCVSPGMIYTGMANVIAGFYSSGYYQNLFALFFEIFPLLDTINAAVNFFVYIIMSNTFRAIFLQNLCKKTVAAQ